MREATVVLLDNRLESTRWHDGAVSGPIIAALGW